MINRYSIDFEGRVLYYIIDPAQRGANKIVCGQFYLSRSDAEEALRCFGTDYIIGTSWMPYTPSGEEVRDE